MAVAAHLRRDNKARSDARPRSAGAIGPAWIAGGGVTLILLLTWGLAAAKYGDPLAFFRPADDGFYYYDIIRSVWNGEGISTDGTHSTTGFHPLWFLVLLPFGAFFRDTGDGLVVVAQLGGILLLGVAVAGVTAAARRVGVGWFAAALGGLTLTFAPWRGVVAAGVEGGLALALLAWLAYWAIVASTTDDLRSRAWLKVGALAGLTILARLDSVFVVGCVVAVLLVGVLRSPQDSRARRQAIVALLGPPAVLVGGYLLVNLISTGHPLPVTASLKSSFPEPQIRTSFFRSYAAYYAALLPMWVGAVLIRDRRHRQVIVALAAGASFFGVYLSLFGQGVFWWHFVSLLPAAAIGASVVVDRVVERAGRPRQTSLAVVIGIAAALVLVVPLVRSVTATYPNGDHYADSGWRVEAHRSADWANENLPADTMLSMKDSGAFGFYTEQPVMNLDGVISDREFNEYLCDGTAQAAMLDTGVKYVVHHAVPEDYEQFVLELPCWDAGTTPTTLRLTPDQEIYRGEPYWHGGSERRFVVWAFDE